MVVSFLLFLLISESFLWAKEPCPPLSMSTEIQNQFQIFHVSSVPLTKEKETEIFKLLDINKTSLQNFRCYYENGQDLNELADALAILKLKIIQLRWFITKNDKMAMIKSLESLREMKDNLIQQPSQLSRRLAASVRSLLLDELEGLLTIDAELVSDQLNKGVWVADISLGLEAELQAEWLALESQFPVKGSTIGNLQNSNVTPLSQKDHLSPEFLAHHFGVRNWDSSSLTRSKLHQWLERLSGISKETLETQLYYLFKANNNNFLIDQTHQTFRYYLSACLKELRQNNYFLIKPWLEPVISEKVLMLKKELGASWDLVSPLVGVTLEGPFREIIRPIELLNKKNLELAQNDYKKVFNPIGRLYEIVFLKRMTQMWTTVDVTQVRMDLNRVSGLKTLIAISNFQKKRSRLPISVSELYQHKLIQEIPKDLFSGKELQYDFLHRQVWSVGENGIDEHGQGDDQLFKIN